MRTEPYILRSNGRIDCYVFIADSKDNHNKNKIAIDGIKQLLREIELECEKLVDENQFESADSLDTIDKAHDLLHQLLVEIKLEDI